ncbi:MAG TPA: inositol monophosphatase family protein [Actinomycetota bacterium]
MSATRPDLPDLARVAELAARGGGEVILGTEAAEAGTPELKGSGDYVTAVDRASEAAIVRLLAEATPGIPVVGEEGGGRSGDQYWLVDPLDGTTNFLHGFPVVAVSVALVRDGAPVAGAVHAPFLGDTYRAAVGSGAWRVAADGTRSPIEVSRRPVERAIVGTGFPFRRKDLLDRYLRTMGAALARFEDLRRPGAAALDLAWVASGVFDGFFELSLAPWDVAAGAVLIAEAGGVVTDWRGGAGYLSGNILAGSPEVHAELMRIATTAP